MQFMAATATHHHVEQKRLVASVVEYIVQDVRMIFEMFDSNNDGTMDLKEFETITNNLQGKGKNVNVTRTGFTEQPE